MGDDRTRASRLLSASMVELRFFAGLEVEEAAAILGVSKETAKLDWRFARAWLNRELAEKEP